MFPSEFRVYNMFIEHIHLPKIVTCSEVKPKTTSWWVFQFMKGIAVLLSLVPCLPMTSHQRASTCSWRGVGWKSQPGSPTSQSECVWTEMWLGLDARDKLGPKGSWVVTCRKKGRAQCHTTIMPIFSPIAPKTPVVRRSSPSPPSEDTHSPKHNFPQSHRFHWNVTLSLLKAKAIPSKQVFKR